MPDGFSWHVRGRQRSHVALHNFLQCEKIFFQHFGGGWTRKPLPLNTALFGPRRQSVTLFTSRASARKTAAVIWRRIYAYGTDFWSRFLEHVSGALHLFRKVLSNSEHFLHNTCLMGSKFYTSPGKDLVTKLSLLGLLTWTNLHFYAPQPCIQVLLLVDNFCAWCFVLESCSSAYI